MKCTGWAGLRAHRWKVPALGSPRHPVSHLFSLMMRFETKSLASSETLSKVSSSKYQLAARTLFRVSVSLSPKKGERPLRLGERRGTGEQGVPWVWAPQIPPARG